MSSGKPRYAILGAGPTGIEAALALAERGDAFTLYEAAPNIAGHIQKWRHVQLFTPWSMNVSWRMRRALEEQGGTLPEDGFPTGGDLIDQVFEPLARHPAIAPHLRLGHKVLSIGRQGLLKHEEIASAERGRRAFRLLLVDQQGHEHLDSADFVFDCTGNGVVNSLGDGGIAARGEQHLAEHIVREIPDFSQEASTFEGRRTLLVGAGHSAQTALRELLALAARDAATRIVWVLRGSEVGVAAGDPLPGRQALASVAAAALAAPPPSLDVRSGRVVESLVQLDDGIEVELRRLEDEGTETVKVDQILALTGRVGDPMIYRQLQVHECYATGAPMKLAAALLGQSGGSGDCLQQKSLGPDTLRSPEPGFFIVGSKSYGRRNDYLLRVGWQQVDEILSLLE